MIDQISEKMARPVQQLILDDNIQELAAALGARLHDLVRELYPINRSITGAGLRATVNRLGQIAPLQVSEVPTGAPVFDWTVPQEWSIEDAYLEHESGRRFAEFSKSNLHVVAYSHPVDTWLTREELRPRIHTLPKHPRWIPFFATFYTSSWGFCLADEDLQSMPGGRYHVVIRSRLEPGSLTLAEFVHPGETDEEILIFSHDCHPSLANDNLSGLAIAIHLAAFLKTRQTRYTYRFVFAPTTIGAIAWLAVNEDKLERIRHGLVLALLGDSGPLRYKKSRTGDRTIDRLAWHVLQTEFPGSVLLDFSPMGYDERQFCSPGVDLPVGRFTRTPNGEFDQYHSSGDNPEFLSTRALSESWLACLRIFEALEAECCYLNLQPKGEPQLGRRGLFHATLDHKATKVDRQMAFRWLLSLSDGKTSLLEIAERSGLPFSTLIRAARELQNVSLLAPMR